MTRLRILFDGEILSHGGLQSSARSGIYMTVFEILRGLVHKGVDVEVLFSSAAMYEGVRVLKASADLSDIRVRCLTPYGVPEKLYGWLYRRGIPPERRIGIWSRIVWLPYRVVRKALMSLLGLVMHLRARHPNFGGETSYDLCLLPSFPPNEYARACGLPMYFVLYDVTPLLFPNYFPDKRVVAQMRSFVRELGPDDRGFAISEATKRDFLRFAPKLREDHVEVVPLAAASRFCECRDDDVIRRVRMRYGIPEGMRYFLSLCTIEPRKNLSFAIRAFAKAAAGRSDVVFVLAGGMWGPYAKEWESALAEAGVARDRLRPIGYVADCDQAALYSGAVGFVYLSRYEGFGLPVLEAMQCGCPVISSNVSSIPEVVGEAALTVAPDDLNGAIAAFERLMGDEGLRKDLRTRGLVRARSFSWDATVDRILHGIGSNGFGIG